MLNTPLKRIKRSLFYRTMRCLLTSFLTSMLYSSGKIFSLSQAKAYNQPTQTHSYNPFDCMVSCFPVRTKNLNASPLNLGLGFSQFDVCCMSRIKRKGPFVGRMLVQVGTDAYKPSLYDFMLRNLELIKPPKANSNNLCGYLLVGGRCFKNQHVLGCFLGPTLMPLNFLDRESFFTNLGIRGHLEYSNYYFGTAFTTQSTPPLAHIDEPFTCLQRSGWLERLTSQSIFGHFYLPITNRGKTTFGFLLSKRKRGIPTVPTVVTPYLSTLLFPFIKLRANFLEFVPSILYGTYSNSLKYKDLKKLRISALQNFFSLCISFELSQRGNACFFPSFGKPTLASDNLLSRMRSRILSPSLGLNENLEKLGKESVQNFLNFSTKAWIEKNKSFLNDLERQIMACINKEGGPTGFFKELIDEFIEKYPMQECLEESNLDPTKHPFLTYAPPFVSEFLASSYGTKSTRKEIQDVILNILNSSPKETLDDIEAFCQFYTAKFLNKKINSSKLSTHIPLTDIEPILGPVLATLGQSFHLDKENYQNYFIALGKYLRADQQDKGTLRALEASLEEAGNQVTLSKEAQSLGGALKRLNPEWLASWFPGAKDSLIAQQANIASELLLNFAQTISQDEGKSIHQLLMALPKEQRLEDLRKGYPVCFILSKLLASTTEELLGKEKVDSLSLQEKFQGFMGALKPASLSLYETKLREIINTNIENIGRLAKENGVPEAVILSLKERQEPILQWCAEQNDLPIFETSAKFLKMLLEERESQGEGSQARLDHLFETLQRGMNSLKGQGALDPTKQPILTSCLPTILPVYFKTTPEEVTALIEKLPEKERVALEGFLLSVFADQIKSYLPITIEEGQRTAFRNCLNAQATPFFEKLLKEKDQQNYFIALGKYLRADQEDKGTLRALEASLEEAGNQVTLSKEAQSLGGALKRLNPEWLASWFPGAKDSLIAQQANIASELLLNFAQTISQDEGESIHQLLMALPKEQRLEDLRKGYPVCFILSKLLASTTEELLGKEKVDSLSLQEKFQGFMGALKPASLSLYETKLREIINTNIENIGRLAKENGVPEAVILSLKERQEPILQWCAEQNDLPIFETSAKFLKMLLEERESQGEGSQARLDHLFETLQRGMNSLKGQGALDPTKQPILTSCLPTILPVYFKTTPEEVTALIEKLPEKERVALEGFLLSVFADQIKSYLPITIEEGQRTAFRNCLNAQATPFFEKLLKEKDQQNYFIALGKYLRADQEDKGTLRALEASLEEAGNQVTLSKEAQSLGGALKRLNPEWLASWFPGAKDSLIAQQANIASELLLNFAQTISQDEGESIHQLLMALPKEQRLEDLRKGYPVCFTLSKLLASTTEELLGKEKVDSLSLQEKFQGFMGALKPASLSPYETKLRKIIDTKVETLAKEQRVPEAVISALKDAQEAILQWCTKQNDFPIFETSAKFLKMLLEERESQGEGSQARLDHLFETLQRSMGSLKDQGALVPTKQPILISCLPTILPVYFKTTPEEVRALIKKLPEEGRNALDEFLLSVFFHQIESYFPIAEEHRAELRASIRAQAIPLFEKLQGQTYQDYFIALGKYLRIDKKDKTTLQAIEALSQETGSQIIPPQETKGLLDALKTCIYRCCAKFSPKAKDPSLTQGVPMQKEGDQLPLPEGRNILKEALNELESRGGRLAPSEEAEVLGNALKKLSSKWLAEYFPGAGDRLLTQQVNIASEILLNIAQVLSEGDARTNRLLASLPEQRGLEGVKDYPVCFVLSNLVASTLNELIGKQESAPALHKVFQAVMKGLEKGKISLCETKLNKIIDDMVNNKIISMLNENLEGPTNDNPQNPANVANENLEGPTNDNPQNPALAKALSLEEHKFTAKGVAEKAQGIPMIANSIQWLLKKGLLEGADLNACLDSLFEELPKITRPLEDLGTLEPTTRPILTSFVPTVLPVFFKIKPEEVLMLIKKLPNDEQKALEEFLLSLVLFDLESTRGTAQAGDQGDIRRILSETLTELAEALQLQDASCRGAYIYLLTYFIKDGDNLDPSVKDRLEEITKGTLEADVKTSEPYCKVGEVCAELTYLGTLQGKKIWDKDHFEHCYTVAVHQILELLKDIRAGQRTHLSQNLGKLSNYVQNQVPQFKQQKPHTFLVSELLACTANLFLEQDPWDPQLHRLLSQLINLSGTTLFAGFGKLETKLNELLKGIRTNCSLLFDPNNLTLFTNALIEEEGTKRTTLDLLSHFACAYILQEGPSVQRFPEKIKVLKDHLVGRQVTLKNPLGTLGQLAFNISSRVRALHTCTWIIKNPVARRVVSTLALNNDSYKNIQSLLEALDPSPSSAQVVINAAGGAVEGALGTIQSVGGAIIRTGIETGMQAAKTGMQAVKTVVAKGGIAAANLVTTSKALLGTGVTSASTRLKSLVQWGREVTQKPAEGKLDTVQEEATTGSTSAAGLIEATPTATPVHGAVAKEPRIELPIINPLPSVDTMETSVAASLPTIIEEPMERMPTLGTARSTSASSLEEERETTMTEIVPVAQTVVATGNTPPHSCVTNQGEAAETQKPSEERIYPAQEAETTRSASATSLTEEGPVTSVSVQVTGAAMVTEDTATANAGETTQAPSRWTSMSQTASRVLAGTVEILQTMGRTAVQYLPPNPIHIGLPGCLKRNRRLRP